MGASDEDRDAMGASDEDRRSGGAPGDREPRLTALLAEPDPLARGLLRDTLQSGGFSIEEEPTSSAEVARLAIERRPDVVLLDQQLPDGDAIEVIRQIKAAGVDVPAVILTSVVDQDAALAALRAGAAGYLGKDIALECLPRALRGVIAGEAAIPRRLARVVVERLRLAPERQRGVRPVRSPLTSREWEVLDLLCEMSSTEQIATELVLSRETVRAHVKKILLKLGASSREEAVELATRMRSGPKTDSAP